MFRTGQRSPASRLIRLAGRSCALFLVLAALGCGGNRKSFFGGDASVRLDADSGINQDSPVAVEMIVVYDKDLLEALLAKTARQWFETREQVLKDHPGDKDFVSMSWEVVPGQSLPPKELSFGTGARGGIVFADYFSDGAHRWRFDPHKDLRIHLQDKEFSVEQPQ